MESGNNAQKLTPVEPFIHQLIMMGAQKSKFWDYDQVMKA